MKTKILLSALLSFFVLSGYSTIWTVTNTNFVFTPDSITIFEGDSVKFTLGDTHNVVEVSQATWLANGNTPLPGFSLPFGGGLLLSSQLTVGMHYYVCGPHASGGMKGIINVQSTSGISENQSVVSVYPNPSSGIFQFELSGIQFDRSNNLYIYNLQGAKIYEAAVSNEKFNVDLSNLSGGIYFVKIFDGEAILTKKIMIQN
ncbi:MAG: T9SS type A sorting domain-containing protein [Bacteroidales bacterium]|nr:T9SS type A sorting domain-containing protein [Bacteroidales bacterium]